MGVEAADDEAAAVEVDDSRERPGRGRERRIEAERQRTGGARQFAVLDPADRYVLRIGQLRQREKSFARLRRRQLPNLRPAGCRDHGEQAFDVRIERHQPFPGPSNTTGRAGRSLTCS